MKIKFEADTPATKYESGHVTLTAGNAHEIVELLDKDKGLKADPVKYARRLNDALSGDEEITWRDPAPHFRIMSSLDKEFSEPYFAAMEELAGCALPEMRSAEIDLTSALGTYKPTRYLLSAVMVEGSLTFVSAYQDYYAAYPGLNGDKMDEEERYSRAHNGATDGLSEELGHRPDVRKFLESANGQYRPNPKYATGFRNPVNPCVGNPAVFDALLVWWRDNMATDAQRHALGEIEEISYGSEGRLLSYGGGPYYLSTLYLPDAGGAVAYGGRAPNARVVKDLSASSLAGWRPGNVLKVSEEG